MQMKKVKKSEFIIRNADKILDSVNSGRTGKNKYFIIQCIFRNFTNSGKNEFVVCFNREEYRRESFFGISTLRLYVFDENEKIIKEYGIDKYVVSILKKNSCMNVWHLEKRTVKVGFAI